MDEEIAMINFSTQINSSPVADTNKFSDNFWGDKLNGFEVLSQNLKNSQTSVKELESFMRELVNCEDQYVKNLNKITTNIHNKFLADSSMSPVWNKVLKDLNEHNSWAHLHYLHRVHELIKEIQSYHEDLRKKRRKIRENEQKTSQLIEALKSARQQLSKTKETYFQIYSEFVQAQQQSSTSTLALSVTLTSSVISTGSGSSNLMKLEKKCALACEEYKLSIEKYNSIRAEFEQRFTDTCNSLQIHEQVHLAEMRNFLFKFTHLLSKLNQTRNHNHDECDRKLNDIYVVEYLIKQFIVNKSTGTDRLPIAEFHEPTSIETNRKSLLSPTPVTDENMDPANLPVENRKRSDSRGAFISIFDFRSRIKSSSTKSSKKSIEKNSLSFSPVGFTDNDSNSSKKDNQIDEEEPSDGSDASTARETQNPALPSSLVTATSLDSTILMNGAKSGEETYNVQINFTDNKNNKENPDFFPAFKDNIDENNVNMVSLSSSESSPEEIKKSQQKILDNSYDYEFNHNSDDDDDEDSFSSSSDNSDAPRRIDFIINPEPRTEATSPDVLNQISKSLQLKLKTPNNSTKPAPRRGIILGNMDEFTDSPTRTPTSTITPPRSISATSFLNTSNIDENNNSIYINTSFTSSNISSTQVTSTSAPPLPPLPPDLKQKFQERILQQQQFQQLHQPSLKTDSNQTLTYFHFRSEPITINSKHNHNVNQDDQENMKF